MATCPYCTSTYNPPVTVPQPIPDKMCFYCATVLTQEQINNLTPSTDANTNTGASSTNPISSSTPSTT